MALESRALEDGGEALEARLAQESADALPPDLPLAEGNVAIAVRAALVPGVVHVEQLELLQPDLGVDLVDERADAVGRLDVVAGGPQVAGVDAEAEPLRPAGLVDQLGGLVEVEAEELGRAGGVLVDHRAALGLGES